MFCAVYGTPEEYSSSFTDELVKLIDQEKRIVATVSFANGFEPPSSQPHLLHKPGKESPPDKSGVKTYTYPEVSSSDFIIPESLGFLYSSAALAHTRSLTFIKKHLDGPHFDLEAIWDEHTYFEFENRSVEKTMATMVREPYVNHIPTVSDPGPRRECSCVLKTGIDDWRHWPKALDRLLPGPLHLEQSR